MDNHLRDGRGDIRELVVDTRGRIDAVLAASYPDLSRARLQRLIATGNATVNDGPVRKSGQVQPGDQVVLTIPAVPKAATETGLHFEILFEDGHILAINKPPGVPVHGAPGDTAPTVAAWFVEHYAVAAALFEAERPGIVHRLDKDTSGVLLLAKTPAAQAALSRAFESREVAKTYIAITEGVPARQKAAIEAAITRHPGDRTRMAIGKNGREARTEYEVLASTREAALVAAHPLTGRTHQIRVHLAAVHAPVRHDRVYGTAGPGRQLLHAWQIRIPHPAGGLLTVTAPLAVDIVREVRALGFDDVAFPFTVATPARLESESVTPEA